MGTEKNVDEIKVEDVQRELFKGLIQLTFKAINQAKEKDVEADMLHAIKENILVLQRYFNGDFD